jgi:DNA-binding transcriptional MerR regulator
MTTVYALAVPTRLSLDRLARQANLHPALVRRYVTLGLVDCTRDASGDLWFSPAAVRRVARVQRLHSDLALNYSAIGLVMDLLDRVDELESALRRSQRRGHEPADPEVPGSAA